MLYFHIQAAVYLAITCIAGYGRVINSNWKLEPPNPCSTTPDQSVLHNHTAIQAETLIQCLSYMQQKSSGQQRAVSYNGTTKQCVVVNDPKNLPEADIYTTTDGIEDHVTCDTRWEKEYEVTADGQVAFGSIAAILASLKKGADIRILIKPGFFIEANNMVALSNSICVYSFFILSKASWDTFESNMFWLFTIACTDGLVFQGRTYLGKTESLPPLKSNKHCIWYTRRLCTEEGRTNPINFASEQGKTIRLGYYSGSAYLLHSLHRLEIDLDSCTVVGHITWNLGRMTSKNQFVNPHYWYMALIDINNSSIRSVTRWYVGTHSLKYESSGPMPLTYAFLESGWDFVFKHDTNGNQISGSKVTLIDHILLGRRVKLVFGSYNMEADNIMIANGIVMAQLLSQIHTPTAKTFESADAVWKWVQITTKGTYAVALYDVGSSNMRGRTVSTIKAGWVVETRVWYLALSTDSSGNTVQGSKSDLKQSVNAGSRLRCVIKGSNMPTLAVTADNIELDTDENIAAQVFRLIDLGDAIPFWRILLITTKGVMRETRWTVGEHIHRGNVDSPVNVDWFVD